jgi:hypothetical protein
MHCWNRDHQPKQEKHSIHSVQDLHRTLSFVAEKFDSPTSWAAQPPPVLHHAEQGAASEVIAGGERFYGQSMKIIAQSPTQL